MRRTENIPHQTSSGAAPVPVRLKALNRTQRHAVLATEAGGQPYTSLIAFAMTPDMRGLIFATPKKTTKYRNMMKNSRVSVMIDTRKNSDKGYMSAESVTIMGNARPVLRGKRRSELIQHLVLKHPLLAEFIEAPTTAIMVVDISRCLHVGKFQAVTEWTLPVKKR